MLPESHHDAQDLTDAFAAGTDRSCLLLADCVIESVLRSLLAARLSLTEYELKELAPHQQTSALVRLAWAAGMLTSREREDLNLISEIRERFALDPLEEKHFSDSDVARTVDRLTGAEFVGGDESPELQHRLRFIWAVANLVRRIQLRAKLLPLIEKPR